MQRFAKIDKIYAALAAAAAFCAVLNAWAFYPGFLSNDSIDQLSQMLHSKPVDNWHPPSLVLAWRVLFSLTHHVSAMLAFQVVLLWGGLALIASYCYMRTKKPLIAALPLLLGLLPFVLNISGVIWKDVQMAFALTFMVGILLWARESERLSLRPILLSLAGLAALYALSLRYNAITALIPLGFIVPALFKKRSSAVLAAFIFLLVFFLSMVFTNRILSVQNRNPSSSIMLDDIVHVASPAELDTIARHSPLLGKALGSLREKCDLQEVLYYVIGRCGTSSDLNVVSTTTYSSVKSSWLRLVFHHPYRYAQYRTRAFLRFVNPVSNDEAYIWQSGIQPNTLGVQVAPRRITSVVKSYIFFFAKDFGFLFRPYTWLLAGGAVILYAKKRHPVREPLVVPLAVSGLLYILSYWFYTSAADFRYFYWSCISISLAALLLLLKPSHKIE